MVNILTSIFLLYHLAAIKMKRIIRCFLHLLSKIVTTGVTLYVFSPGNTLAGSNSSFVCRLVDAVPCPRLLQLLHK